MPEILQSEGDDLRRNFLDRPEERQSRRPGEGTADLEAAEKEMAFGVVGTLLGMRDCKTEVFQKKEMR